MAMGSTQRHDKAPGGRWARGTLFRPRGFAVDGGRIARAGSGGQIGGRVFQSADLTTDFGQGVNKPLHAPSGNGQHERLILRLGGGGGGRLHRAVAKGRRSSLPHVQLHRGAVGGDSQHRQPAARLRRAADALRHSDGCRHGADVSDMAHRTADGDYAPPAVRTASAAALAHPRSRERRGCCPWSCEPCRPQRERPDPGLSGSRGR